MLWSCCRPCLCRQSPSWGCLFQGLVVDCLHPPSCYETRKRERVEGQVFTWRDNMPKEWGADRARCPWFLSPYQLAWAAWPSGRVCASGVRACSWGLLCGWRLHQRLLQLLQWQCCDLLLQTQPSTSQPQPCLTVLKIISGVSSKQWQPEVSACLMQLHYLLMQ